MQGSKSRESDGGVAAFQEFRLISAIVGLFQNAKARQFHAFQHVLNQVRLVRDPLLQMRSAEEWDWPARCVRRRVPSSNFKKPMPVHSRFKDHAASVAGRP